MASRRQERVGHQAYIEYLLLDRLLALRGTAVISELVHYFQTESSAITDAECRAGIDRLVEEGAAHRAGEHVRASSVARYVTSLPERVPEFR